jgi:hypothetical protein
MTADPQNDLIASAGKIHLLNLSALKDSLGSKWERMSAHVQQFFEAAIKRSLKPGDTFCRHEEFSYLIMFRELSAAEAELKCAAISDEVCRRLFGENGTEVSMRNLIAHVGLNTVPTDAKQKASLDALLEREGKEVVITRRDESSAISSGTKPIRLTMGNNPLSRTRAFAQEIEYVYRPIWDSINHVVLTYLCQPTVPGLPSNAMSDFCTAEDDDDQATLDLHVLRECLERGSRLRTAGLRVVLAVPVHFMTVARARSWRAYSDTLRQIDEEIRRDLAPVVFGIDYGVPHVRLAQELPKLSRMSYRVFCVVDRCQGAGARFAKSAAHGVGIALDEKEDEPRSATRLRELAREAQSATVESFALGLRSTSLALAAISAGIRYLEGPVVRPAVTDPRHGFAHDVEDMYKTKRLRAVS